MRLQKYQEGYNAFCLVDLLSLNNPILCDKLKKSKNINISCIEDKELNATFYKCEIASISFVLALLCKLAMKEEFKELDEGYLSAESCFGEEEALEVLDFLKQADCIIFDENLKKHKDYENIKYFLKKLSELFELYLINSKEIEEELTIQENFNELLELENYDGLVVFNTASCSDILRCSTQFAFIAKVKDNEAIVLKIQNQEFHTVIKIDKELKGTVALFNCQNLDFIFSKVQVEVKK